MFGCDGGLWRFIGSLGAKGLLRCPQHFVSGQALQTAFRKHCAFCIMWTVIHPKFHARTWSRMSVQNAGSCQQHKQKLSGTLQACPDLQYLQDLRHDASSQKSENLALTQNLNELSIRPTADAWGSHGHGAYGAILGCRGCRLSLSFSWLVEFLVWPACQALLPCRHP